MAKRAGYSYNPQYPSVQDLARKAKQRMPGFAHEYLVGGANDEHNLSQNQLDFKKVELMPRYIAEYGGANLQTELFGTTYSAPFGVAPIGLQGLMWPNSPSILAKAAAQHAIPFVLSTVSTNSIEEIGQVTGGNFWFQLYHPAEDALRDDLLERAWQSGCRVLVVLADTPSFGFRYRDIRNGLAMPPTMSLRNVAQMLRRPGWSWRSLRHGQPQFASLVKYMPKGLDLKALAQFMNQTFDGRLTPTKLQALRKAWPGKLVVKGVVNPQDAAAALQAGAEGIIVSNHGGRQLDAGQSTIAALPPLVAEYGHQLEIVLDGGLRSGPDIARALASGAKMVFLGRPFMWSVAALGSKGGSHLYELLHAQLKQVMEQLGCEDVRQLPNHLI